jgi:ATP-dependent Clp protease ATP-binding subunit ClpA
MFERFEPAALQAVTDARQEAAWAGQDAIRSEHLLISLLRGSGLAADTLAQAGLDLESLRALLPHGDFDPPGGLDANALATLGIDLDAVRRATDSALGQGALDRARVPGQRSLPFAHDARQVLVGAVRQAHQHGQRQISSGHLLIGILDADSSGALTALSQAGADAATLRADVLRKLGPAPDAGRDLAEAASQRHDDAEPRRAEDRGDDTASQHE